MSTATAPDTATAPPKKGKKKLLIMVGGAVLALALVGGGGAVWYLKKKHAAEAEAEAEAGGNAESHAKATAKRDPKAVPTFVPLDPFTVNLADREADRYAQVGMSLELGDASATDQIKAYMPVIRNNILMVLAHKTAGDLLERDGKTKLAAEILSETSRALGYEPLRPAVAAAAAPADDDEDPDAPKKKKKAKPVEPDPKDASPVIGVHFSNFIIQ
jgi:flagellar protein FliL